MPVPPDFIVDRSYLAELFGVSERAVNYFLEEGMPRVGHGRYDLRACTQWYLANKKRRPTRDDSAQIELLRAQCKKIELQVSIMRGDLIEAEAVKRAIFAMASTYTSQLDSLAPRMAGELADVQDAAYIESRLAQEARSIQKAVALAAG